MQTRSRVLAGGLILVGGVSFVVWRRRVQAETASEELWVPDAPAERPAPALELPTERSGHTHDRGKASTVKMDLTRARAHHLEPVIEFLTFVQDRRGDRSHLMFVRYDDLDAIAESAGEEVEEFLGRLDQLGVIISQN